MQTINPRVALTAAVVWLVLWNSGAAEQRAADPQQLRDATRQVLERIVAAAAANAGRPDKDQIRGDELAEHYVKVAAAAAKQLPEEVRGQALVLGLGIACDHTDSLRKLPLIGNFVEQVEEQTARRRRLKIIGRPTIYMREDLALHFFVSAYLTAALGAVPAEAAGLAKEFKDADGGSGFSFIDLAADKAGIQLAQRILDAKVELDDLATQFKMSEHMPAIDGLVEGIPIDQFRRDFGSTDDERFRKVMDEIRQRVESRE